MLSPLPPGRERFPCIPRLCFREATAPLLKIRSQQRRPWHPLYNPNSTVVRYRNRAANKKREEPTRETGVIHRKQESTFKDTQHAHLRIAGGNGEPYCLLQYGYGPSSLELCAGGPEGGGGGFAVSVFRVQTTTIATARHAARPHSSMNAYTVGKHTNTHTHI